jgi:hypothetical protein
MDRPQQPPLLQLALLAAVIAACSLAGWAGAGRSLDHLPPPGVVAGLVAAAAIAVLALAWYRQHRSCGGARPSCARRICGSTPPSTISPRRC